MAGKRTFNQVMQNLPDWAKERRIMILAGTELLAVKLPWSNWKVKKIRCDNCGHCCMTYPSTPWGVDNEGKCLKLEKQGDKWICTAGIQKPYNCLQDPNSESECCIEYEEIDD